MSMTDRIRELEEETARLRKEQALEGEKIEERKAAGRPLRSRRWMDLGRAIRKNEREIRDAKTFLKQAEERKLLQQEELTAEAIEEALREVRKS